MSIIGCIGHVMARSSLMGDDVTCTCNEWKIDKSMQWLSMLSTWILSILTHEEYKMYLENIMSGFFDSPVIEN